jgi:hypothetical protein
VTLEDPLRESEALAARRDDTVIRVGWVLIRNAIQHPAGRFRPLANAIRGGRADRPFVAGSSNLAGFPPSLADASVDPFPQQVGVAAVAGVLLDHVDKHFAQRDGVSVWHSPADAEVGGVGDELLREGDLVAPCLPGIVCDRWVGDRAGSGTVSRSLLSVTAFTLARPHGKRQRVPVAANLLRRIRTRPVLTKPQSQACQDISSPWRAAADLREPAP